MPFAISPAPISALPIVGSDARFPVRRIFCIGRNYAEHAREMGGEVDRASPVFFTKPADAIVAGGGDIAYPPATSELHHEVEMVVALGGGGRDVDAAQALQLVWGYGVGLDLTRRDLQAAAKARGMPWDTAKAFDHSAPISALRPLAAMSGHPQDVQLSLRVNGEVRQRARTSEMVFSVAETLAELSKLFELKPGDLLFTGTPAGVGPLLRGDSFEAELEGVAQMRGRIV